jgi:hypothetical protein
VVFPKTELEVEWKVSPEKIVETREVTGPWQLSFPSGWGAPKFHNIDKLTAWKELDLSPEAKSFSGSVIYSTTLSYWRVGEWGKLLDRSWTC